MREGVAEGRRGIWLKAPPGQAPIASERQRDVQLRNAANAGRLNDAPPGGRELREARRYR